MTNPKEVLTIKEGATYSIPLYAVADTGIVDSGRAVIRFCKGNKENKEIFRQEGLFTESLIAVAKEYLQDVNVGELASRETSMAITKLDEALMWINKRADDRKLRGVQATYNK